MTGLSVFGGLGLLAVLLMFLFGGKSAAQSSASQGGGGILGPIVIIIGLILLVLVGLPYIGQIFLVGSLYQAGQGPQVAGFDVSTRWNQAVDGFNNLGKGLFSLGVGVIGGGIGAGILGLIVWGLVKLFSGSQFNSTANMQGTQMEGTGVFGWLAGKITLALAMREQDHMHMMQERHQASLAYERRRQQAGLPPGGARMLPPDVVDADYKDVTNE